MAVTEKKMFVAGQWVFADGRKAFDVHDPATGEVIATAPEAQSSDVGAAVAHARDTFDGGKWWPKTSDRDRGKILRRAAEIVEREQENLARLDCVDSGKPIAEARIDIEDCVMMLDYFAGFADKIDGTIPPAGSDGLSLVIPEPMGVVAAIIPWNYPLALAIQKIAPALAAGCVLILKPAEQTPLSALELPRIFEEAGLPSGVLQVITGHGPVGAELAAHPGVDKVTFTGSRDVGTSIMRSAANSIKRVTLELGGKSPNIVFADAEFGRAVEGSCSGIFSNQGEMCTAGSRVLVERSIYDDVLAAMETHVGAIRLGSGLDEGITMGPLVSRAQKERVQNYIAIGKSESRTAAEGSLPTDPKLANGYFVPPVIFAEVDNHSRLAQEEIFGPVMSVIPFDGIEQAVELANDSIYGLAAAIWTKDIKKAFDTARAVRAGQIWINDTQAAPVGAPSGGFKQSGFGRELGREGVLDYMESKSIYVNLGV